MHNQVKKISHTWKGIYEKAHWDQWDAPIKKGSEQCVTEWLQLSATIWATEMVRIFNYVQQKQTKN